MKKSVSAADAAKKVSQVRRQVKSASARNALLRSLHSEPIVKIGRWKWDELYD
jgi:hypothetical protein